MLSSELAPSVSRFLEKIDHFLAEKMVCAKNLFLYSMETSMAHEAMANS
jgi:hypothetical protein